MLKQGLGSAVELLMAFLEIERSILPSRLSKKRALVKTIHAVLTVKQEYTLKSELESKTTKCHFPQIYLSNGPFFI